MNKDVLVSISGLQIMDENRQPQPLEVITPGEYYSKNGRDYIFYEEVMEGFDEVTKSRIKIADGSLDILKKGVSNTHMVFEQGKTNMTCYDTPFGSIVLGIRAGDVEISRSEDTIDVAVDYALDVNDLPMADCRITINIQSRAQTPGET